MTNNKEMDAAVAAAIALAEKTSATAEALAQAKVTSDIAAAVMATNVERIKEDIHEIKESLKADRITFVTVADFNEVVKSLAALEIRTRALETSVTRILTWGSILAFLSTLSSIILLIMKLNGY